MDQDSDIPACRSRTPTLRAVVGAWLREVMPFEGDIAMPQSHHRSLQAYRGQRSLRTRCECDGEPSVLSRLAGTVCRLIGSAAQRKRSARALGLVTLLVRGRIRAEMKSWFVPNRSSSRVVSVGWSAVAAAMLLTVGPIRHCRLRPVRSDVRENLSPRLSAHVGLGGGR